MAENSSRESLHVKEEVLGTVNASFDKKLSLEDDVRQLKSHATVNKEQSKKQCGSDLTSCQYIPCCSLDSNHGQNKNNVGDNASLDKKTAVSFNIQVDDTCRKQPPKRLLTKTTHKKSTTIEVLNEKQKQAEKRRKQQRENKLQRIHDRQEAARKLAHNVDILLQQRALAMGNATNDVKPLPTREIMTTAHQVAQNFRDLTNQLDSDLSVGKRLDMKKAKPSCTRSEIQHETRKAPHKRQSTSQSQSIWFTVDGKDSPAKSRKPALPARKKKAITAEDIEEKQRKAEERRNARQERKVKKARENREALMNMAKDIERFKNLQEVRESSSPNSIQHSKESAILAEKIADGFDRLSQRYSEDLKRAENFYIEQPYIVRP